MALVAACIGVFITPLFSTPFNMAERLIMQEYGIGAYEVGWVSALYLLSIVVFMMPAGKLCSIYGKKRIFQVGMLTALVSSALCLVEMPFELLCALRIVMGLGVAFVSCSGISIITDVFPPKERGWAMGVCMACIYVALSLGPLIGILISAAGDWWRIIAVIPIPVSIVALLFISRVDMKNDSEKTPFDVLGTIVYGVGISCSVYGMTKLPEYWAIALMIFGLILLGAFVKIELSKNNPMINLKVFGNTVFRRSIIALILNYAASGAIVYFMNIYLQSVCGQPASQAGLILVVQPVIQTIVTLAAGRISDRIDQKILPTAGMLLISFGLVMLMFMDKTFNPALVVSALAVLGVGFGLFSAPNTNCIMSSVSKEYLNDASAMMNTMRQLGMVISTGITMVFVSAVVGQGVQVLPDTPELFDDFVTAIRITLPVFIAFGIIGALFSWFRGDSREN